MPAWPHKSDRPLPLHGVQAICRQTSSSAVFWPTVRQVCRPTSPAWTVMLDVPGCAIVAIRCAVWRAAGKRLPFIARGRETDSDRLGGNFSGLAREASATMSIPLPVEVWRIACLKSATTTRQPRLRALSFNLETPGGISCTLEMVMLGTVGMVMGLLAIAGFLMWLVECDAKRSAKKPSVAPRPHVVTDDLEATRPIRSTQRETMSSESSA